MKFLIVLLFMLFAGIARCDDWPKYFDNFSVSQDPKNKFTWVVLYQNGSAEFITREVSSSGEVRLYHDGAAKWESGPAQLRKLAESNAQYQTLSPRFYHGRKGTKGHRQKGFGHNLV